MREEARGLLNGLFPALHEREALRGEPGGQSELVHLHGGRQFHDEALTASESLGGFPHPLDSRSRTVHASGVPRRRHDLAERILDIRGVVRIVLLGGEMDDVLLGIPVRQSGPVLADRDEVLAEFPEKEVDVDARLLVIPGGAVLLCPMLLDCLSEGLRVSEWEGGLFDIEERMDLTVADRGVLRLLLGRELVVLLLRDSASLFCFAPVFVPPVPDERDSLLAGLHALAPLFGAGVRRVQVRMVSSPVTVEREDEGVEGRDTRLAGIEPRGCLARLVKQVPVFRAGTLEGLGQKFLLALCRMLF